MKIQVGDPSVNWFALQPQSDDKEVLLVEGGSVRSVGVTSEEIVLIEIASKPALRRTQMLKSAMLGDRTTKTIIFRETFLPHSHCDITEDHKISITYQSNQVVGEKQLKGERGIPINDEIEFSVFDYHSVEMIIRVLPLAEDYVAQIPIYHAMRQTQMNVTVHVLGQETVTIPQGSVDTWKVQTDWNGVTQYYWIGIENRELVKQSSKISESVLLEFVRM
ncbi:MAG TPA: hypothetical protein VLF17_07370 [Candidatus Nitrosotenuis sp.]|nr:hypothetical protein [Candidatus Nitrosotenuis sp.]